MRKPSRAVELEDIISSNIIGDDPEVIAVVLKTHLALEAILIEMLRLTDPSDTPYKKNFPAKTRTLVNSRLLSEHDRTAFDRFNDFRNDLAHVFAHQLSLADTLKLARELEADGVDFSDSAGHSTEQQAIDSYGGTIGILTEIGWCLLCHAANCLSDAGGRDVFAARGRHA